ncbi:hypothetical protein C8R46DRAFT_1232613 [Mycena filopes]|nr:hypothetical protein C8R46DRAFT_1232613 [Mycena filopes]
MATAFVALVAFTAAYVGSVKYIQFEDIPEVTDDLEEKNKRCGPQGHMGHIIADLAIIRTALQDQRPVMAEEDFAVFKNRYSAPAESGYCPGEMEFDTEGDGPARSPKDARTLKLELAKKLPHVTARHDVGESTTTQDAVSSGIQSKPSRSIPIRAH